MKKILLFLFFQLIVSIRIIFSDIMLTSIHDTYIYNNFSDDLFPFTYSTKIIKIDKNITLKLINEIDYTNGLLGDILKVEIMNGPNRGDTGYLYEEYVKLKDIQKKNNVNMFFKTDTLLGKYLIKKNTQCIIMDSKIEDEHEVLYLQLLNTDFKDQTFIYTEKNDLHFIINKESEISYYLRKDYFIIKIIDPETLLPIDNVFYNGQKSDKDGFIYIESKKDLIVLNKEGYSEGYAFTNKKDEKIYLCFMSKIDYLRGGQEKNINVYNDLFSLKIKSDSLGIKILKQNTLNIFSYPPIEDKKNYRIKTGFYIKKDIAAFSAKLNLNLKEKSIELIHFDNINNKWKNVTLEKKENEYSASISEDGYFLILSNESIRYKTISIDKQDYSASTVFFKDKNGEYYSRSNFNSKIELPEGKYELLFFTTAFPFNLIQKIISADKDDKNSFKISDLINTKNIFEQKGFSRFYNGNWIKRMQSINDMNITEKNDIFEMLGDLFLENESNLTFASKKFRLSGFINIIDNKKLYIYINSCDMFLKETITDQYFFVDPSLFNSQIIIPCFYSFKAGLFEIDFNNIYFSRKNIYKTNIKTENILIDSYTIGFPKFPESDKKSVYKLYFTQ